MATNKNEIRALIKSPYINLLPLIVKNKFEKSGVLAIAPINGVSKSFTRAFTTVPNDAPITTPTARSMALPRRMNFLKPSKVLNIVDPTGVEPATSSLQMRRSSQLS